MTLQIQPFAILAYGAADEGGTRQLFVVNSPGFQQDLRDEAERLSGGNRNGDWYIMSDWHGVNALQQLTTQLGGFAFDLPKVN